VRGYVVSANQRLAALPDIPSANEGGINYQMSIWAGIFAPKGTPNEVIAKLANALEHARPSDRCLVGAQIAEQNGHVDSVLVARGSDRTRRACGKPQHSGVAR
jgi:tripartite-type tricarboxylate transporter receptor subunit TctC